MATETSTSDRSIADRVSGWSTSTLLIAIGTLLFVIPEPNTSVLGIVVLAVAVLNWAVGRFL